ncbi:reverse transcriptase domain-containing protein [Tanacetum coccineum]|uniref:Reverse transcriptase domain-containing protein n=1 Tax=Tanacetum coccineum TaxID=301880 RepID=A0ABQ5GBM9_9ASTR
MSSASSTITYTSVYTDSEPGRVFWGADEEISDGGIPRVIAHDPDYVPEPIYPEYIPLEDEHVFPVEEQPLPPVDSPTAESPGYVAESDPEEDPEEYEDDETEDGPVDYPMDGGDDGDDDDGDSSRDDADDEDEDEEDEEEEEEEHPALADSAVIVPTVEPASISLPLKAEVERLLAMPTPSPSPPISLSPPSARERLARCKAPPAHSSSPSVPSLLLPSSGCPTQIQTLKIASTQALIDAVTAALPSPTLPPLPPSLYIPPPVDRMNDIPESEQPPSKRLCLSTLGSTYEIGESSIARPTGGRGIDYGFVSTVDLAEAVPEIAPMTVGEDGRTCISQRVAIDSQRVNLLIRDRMTLQETVWIVEEEGYASREAWAHSIGLSQATHQELQIYRDHVYAHETHIQAHQAQLQLQSTLIQTQHQAHMAETLRVVRDMRREMSDIQAKLLAHREQQRRARQPGPDARILDHQDAFGMLTVTSSGLCYFVLLGPEAYSMTWEVLKKKITDKYCPQGEIKKLEIELWNLKVKGNDVPTYTERFQELTLICTKFFANETEKVDKYISGLLDNIYGNVKSARPKMLDETIELANDLMD